MNDEFEGQPHRQATSDQTREPRPLGTSASVEAGARASAPAGARVEAGARATAAAGAGVLAGAAARPRARERVGTILAIYAVHLAIAVAVVGPMVGVLSSETRRLGRGDAVLFDPGGLFLLEAVRRHAETWLGMLPVCAWIVVLTSYFGLLPLGALVHALNRRGRVTVAELTGAAGRYFARYSVLWCLALLAMGAVAGITSLALLAMPVQRGTGSVMVVAGVLVLLGLATVGALGIVHDLARAAAVRFDLGAERSLRVGMQAMAEQPLRIAFAWGWRAAMASAWIAAAAFVCGRASLSTRLDVLAVFVVHQFVAAVLVALRASWLARALRFVAMPDPD